MPQSLARMLNHLIFSTKNRDPFLHGQIRPKLHAYMGGSLRERRCLPIQVGGVEDHVHLVFALDRQICMADLVGEIKVAATGWLKRQGIRDFSWQEGYGVYSIGVDGLDRVVAYVKNQEEHHRKVAYQDEFRALMAAAGLEIDERYVWD